jgi:hypothetical protein
LTSPAAFAVPPLDRSTWFQGSVTGQKGRVTNQSSGSVAVQPTRELRGSREWSHDQRGDVPGNGERGYEIGATVGTALNFEYVDRQILLQAVHPHGARRRSS